MSVPAEAGKVRQHAAGWVRLPLLALGAICFVPLALTAPGRVGADTKTYLYLDPARLLSRAASMWDPHVGMGTVTHQNIGYLFPMGPYYWLAEATGVPDWFAQRIWLGSILFASGAGVWFLLREMGLSTPARTAAMFTYALTPYTLTLAARISVILLPFAALPWLIALTARAIRRGGWRDPAAFALVVVCVGGVNATALVFVGLGPLLWILYTLVRKEASIRALAIVVARIGLLTLATSAWWLSGLWAQGAYGINILRYTETAEAVASAAVAVEILRGLGYWFFYGGDRLGPWIEPGRMYTQRLWLLVVSFALPTLALLAAAVTRWRERAYFVGLLCVGVFVSVAAHPWANPSLAGRGWKAVLLSERGLALRSTPRAVPLVALSLAVLLGAGVAAVGTRLRDGRVWAVAATVVALAVANMPALFTGGMVADNLQRPEVLPAYWTAAAAHLDQQGEATRVLELPGVDFASYRWGSTVDPITPG
ncbi:MAG: alpha-(1-_3)-arabinofuranosyltransferase domain-containing protein, partial [Acidimicrobiales bacterium]